MNKFVKISLLFVVSSSIQTLLAQNNGMPNPAAVYCELLGYKYETQKAKDGSEYGVCKFPDGSECDAFAFFRGECGNMFSNCALKGCTIITNKEDGTIFPACSCSDSLGKKHLVPLIEFMEQHGDTLFRPNLKIKASKKQLN